MGYSRLEQSCSDAVGFDVDCGFRRGFGSLWRFIRIICVVDDNLRYYRYMDIPSIAGVFL